MRKLTLTFAAACCFALLSAQAQAVAAGPQPEPPYAPELRAAQTVVGLAADTFEDGARGLSLSRVSPQEERAKYIALAYLRQGERYERYAMYYLNRADDTLALMRNSKASNSLIAEFEGYRGAAVRCTGVALNRASIAYSQPSYMVRYRSAPSLSRALEAHRRNCEFRNRSVWDLVDEGSEPSPFGPSSLRLSWYW